MKTIHVCFLTFSLLIMSCKKDNSKTKSAVDLGVSSTSNSTSDATGPKVSRKKGVSISPTSDGTVVESLSVDTSQEVSGTVSDVSGTGVVNTTAVNTLVTTSDFASLKISTDCQNAGGVWYSKATCVGLKGPPLKNPTQELCTSEGGTFHDAQTCGPPAN